MKQISTSLTILTIFLCSQARAQNENGKITGSLADKKGNAVIGTIVLKSLADTMLIRRVSSNDKGQFSFEKLPFGKFLVTINALGFKTIYEKIEITSENFSIPKTFKMTSESNDLGSISISGRKPLIERLSDKTVMNVENSLVATGNTALEVLAKMPGVTVNQDGVKIGRAHV